MYAVSKVFVFRVCVGPCSNQQDEFMSHRKHIHCKLYSRLYGGGFFFNFLLSYKRQAQRPQLS